MMFSKFFVILGVFLSTFSVARGLVPHYFFNSAYWDQAQSNLYLGVSKVNEGKSDTTGIYIYSLQKKSGQWIQLSGELESQHLIGIYPSKESGSLFVLSQLRKAGTAKPFLSQYNISTKKFSIVKRELDCANVLESKSEAGELHLKCGDDPHFQPAKKTLIIKVPQMLSDANRHLLTWATKSPNSLHEEKSLLFKYNSETLQLNVESLFN
ncbi:MAG: hypothetical protein R3A80_02275 [Bdellovibrionota bacterium]